MGPKGLPRSLPNAVEMSRTCSQKASTWQQRANRVRRGGISMRREPTSRSQPPGMAADRVRVRQAGISLISGIHLLNPSHPLTVR
eukprot:7838494-Pyramimonas_sp.AAC.1